jgi:hypothetical protein
VNSIHFFIQDKWKDTTTQQEVSQFLLCADRLRARLPQGANYYLLWVSKQEPTANSLKILKEKQAVLVTTSIGIEALTKLVVLQIADCAGVDSTAGLQSVPKRIPPPLTQDTQRVQTPPSPTTVAYDDSEEGKQKIEAFKKLIRDIHNKIIIRGTNAVNLDGGCDIQTIWNTQFPRTPEEWWSGKMSKIDYTAFLKAAKQLLWPTAKKKLQSRNLFLYVKFRKLSVEFATVVNSYESARKDLLTKKSSWAKQTPSLKAAAEPITEAEYKGALENCEDYWYLGSLMSGYNALTKSQAIEKAIKGERIERLPQRHMDALFYSYQCMI